jgi:hypothetical protein
MTKDPKTLSELRQEIDSSLRLLEHTEKKASGKKSLIQDVRKLKSAVISVSRFLLATSIEGYQRFCEKTGTCPLHERLRLVIWERGDVPCPVCERNKFIESQAEKVGISSLGRTFLFVGSAPAGKEETG